MQRPVLCAAMLAITCCAAANAQLTATLRTRQTTVELEATEQGPRLTSLRSEQLPAWTNTASEDLVKSAEIDGKQIPLHWEWDRQRSRVAPDRVAFVYESRFPRLRLSWNWVARAGVGPVEHSIQIQNLEARELWLPLQDSFAFRFNVAPGQELTEQHIDKGAGKPTEIGTHRDPVAAGYAWEARSSSYARDGADEVIPWFMLERGDASRDGWYAGIEFSGRTHIILKRDHASVYGSVGLNPNPGPFRTRLSPSETFQTPPIFLGGFRGGADELGNVLRPWVRRVLNNPQTWKDPGYPVLVNNSWGSGMQIDEPLAMRMLGDSSELGLEMFHIDAGWFRGVGDWYPDPAKFPHGLAPIAAEAHRRGLKFGIWVNWAQAGADSNPGALNAHDPAIRDWLVADAPPDWKPQEFVGRTMDLGVPAVKDYAQHELNRMIADYHLDMLEHDGYLVAKNCARADHPHATAIPPQMPMIEGSGIAMADASNSTDVDYHAVNAYYEIYSRLRREHPELLLEICNDGGRMVDFGSASHGDYFSMTDSYDPLSNRRAFYDASHLLPPAMLEAYVAKWTAVSTDEFRYMLRSGMMGWLTIMQDTTAWTREQHAAAKAEFALYKQALRPLIRDADLYHVSERPDGVHWDGIEYFDRARRRGVLYAFRGTAPGIPAHLFVLKGLRGDRAYRVLFRDHPEATRVVNGGELNSQGLRVVLPRPQTSELVFLEEQEPARPRG
ncbi:MAG: glycoside hydrolase family 36 protein [Acidobacteriaceae bacterium]